MKTPMEMMKQCAAALALAALTGAGGLAAPALADEEEPTPLMELPVFTCGPGQRMVMRHFFHKDEDDGVVFRVDHGSCESAREGEMRLNGVPMGVQVWHPNPAYGHTDEADRKCKGGTIPDNAKAPRILCFCPEETHEWRDVGSTRYCFVKGEAGPEDYKNFIPGWDEWEPELEAILAGNLPRDDAKSSAFGPVCNIDTVRDALPAGDREADRQLFETASNPAAYGDVCNLLAEGADPNYNGRNNAAPLHRTVADNAVENVRLLLAAGADPNAQNANGMTPLDRAEKLGRPGIANLLKEAGGACSALSGGLCE